MTARNEVIKSIETTLVELKGVAQPHELASLSELLLDARDAETAEQLEQIEEQVKGLRVFCERRAKSTANFQKVTPPGWRPRS
jgi:hypothetical protein